VFCLWDGAPIANYLLIAAQISAQQTSGSRAVRNKLCCYLFGLISRANQRNEASRRRQAAAGRERERERGGWVSRRIKKFPRHQQIFCVMTLLASLPLSSKLLSRPNFSETRVLRSLRPVKRRRVARRALCSES
jgi:hypothetical protein